MKMHFYTIFTWNMINYTRVGSGYVSDFRSDFFTPI